jgi:hypothetical protein
MSTTAEKVLEIFNSSVVNDVVDVKSQDDAVIALETYSHDPELVAHITMIRSRT